MQRLFFLFYLLCANSAILTAQNLVQNPGFEVNTGGYVPLNKPTDRANFEQHITNWQSANGTSPDIVNTDDAKKADKKSTISPHSGKSCVGLAYLIRPVSEQNWQEVITTQLSAPLRAGKRYSVSFWINYSPLSKKHNQTYASPKFGAYLHEKALRTNTDKPLSAPFQIGISNRKIIANEWILVTDFVVPTTGLSYLSIGFWAKPQHTLEAYYYLDDVAIEEVAVAPVAVIETKKETLPNLTIKDIGFETGKAELSADAKKLLDNFVADFNLLQFKGSFLVAGHTDNTGNATLNENLSQKRAEAVNNYLSQLGISPTKLHAKGYGVTQPIDDNTTENGRSRNRRVQITLEKCRLE